MGFVRISDMYSAIVIGPENLQTKISLIMSSIVFSRSYVIQRKVHTYIFTEVLVKIVGTIILSII